MKNCLVTKLKGSVNNDNLLKLGKLRINKVSEETEFNKILNFSINTSEPVTATSRNSEFLDSNGASIGSSILIPGNASVYQLRFGLAEGIFDIDKYNITNLNTTYSALQVVCPIQSLQYMTQLTHLDIGVSGDFADIEGWDNIEIIKFKHSSPVSGNIAVFANKCQKAVEIVISYPPEGQNIYGDITSLGSITSLINLRIIALHTLNIRGSLERFVDAQRANGRTTCNSFSLWLLNTNVTFNGADLGYSGTAKELSWTSDTITYDGTTISA